jgi:hypothetical protein
MSGFLTFFVPKEKKIQEIFNALRHSFNYLMYMLDSRTLRMNQAWHTEYIRGININYIKFLYIFVLDFLTCKY